MLNKLRLIKSWNINLEKYVKKMRGVASSHITLCCELYILPNIGQNLTKVIAKIKGSSFYWVTL